MEIIGYLAATLTTISFLPQLIQVIKNKSTKDINLIMYIAFVTGVALWTIYGYVTMNLPIALANTFTFAFASVILTFKIINTINGKDKKALAEEKGR